MSEVIQYYGVNYSSLEDYRRADEVVSEPGEILLRDVVGNLLKVHKGVLLSYLF